jgi:transposase-like protein
MLAETLNQPCDMKGLPRLLRWRMTATASERLLIGPVASGISKSEVSRDCQETDRHVRAFLGLPLHHARCPYVYLDTTYLHGRESRNMQVVSRAVVGATGINLT